MAEKTINARIQCKIDTAENWKTNNPVLLVGELGVESDTKLIKVGDGTTSWTSLPYLQYLPLSGGQLTGALKIAKGTGNGIQNYDGTPLLYIDNYDDLYIRNDGGTEIHLGWAGEHIQIGGNKVHSDTNVVGRSFTYNDKSVAVTDNIPKTLNNKTLVANGNTTIYGTDITLASDNTSNLTDAISNVNTQINNLTTVVNGKADTSDIPNALYQLSEDTTHRVVTDTEKATWNAKSNFDGNYNSLTNKPTIPTKTSQLTNDSNFATTSQIPTKTSQLTNDSGFATTSQIPDISGKANLSGGNTFSGNQTFNNAVNIKGTGKCRNKVLVTYNLGSAQVKIREWGIGRIDYLLGDGKTLRHEFGQAWINDGVTFTNAYSTVLWCTATPDCSVDSQIQRFSINSCSTTKMTFKGGADQIVRWEVWGIIN